MLVKELMSQPAVTCPVGSTLDHAARLMWENDCGVIPVVNDADRLEGVITDRDICMAAYTQGRPLGAIPVTSAMARNVVAAYADDLVETAEMLMGENHVRRLPVLGADGQVCGVVAMNDVIRLARRLEKSSVDREVVRMLSIIGEPRHERLELASDVTQPEAVEVSQG